MFLRNVILTLTPGRSAKTQKTGIFDYTLVALASRLLARLFVIKFTSPLVVILRSRPQM
jgi:hypothetical protein